MRQLAADLLELPTNCLASVYQLCNNLPREFLAEDLVALVNKDDPIWDFGRFKQEFVDPSKYDTSHDTSSM